MRFVVSRLKHFFSICLIVIAVTLLAGLSYLHEYGFSEETGDRLAKEMERYGVYLEFDHLSFYLLQGLTANNVTVYRTAARENKIAHVPSLSIHVDKSKLMRGKLKITTVSLSQAELSIPLSIGSENSPFINISDVSGSIDLPGDRAIRTTNLTGIFEGINLDISLNVWGDQRTAPTKDSPEQLKERILAYNRLLDTLKTLQWAETTPPSIKLFVEGNSSRPDELEIETLIDAPELTYKGYTVNNVKLKGDFSQNLLTIDSFSFENQSDPFSLTADFDFIQKSGRFQLDSKIHFQHFALEVFEKRLATDLHSTGKTHLTADGEFVLPRSTDEKFSISMAGAVQSNNFTFRGTPVNQMKSEFSWNNGDLYLDDIELEHPLGKVTGRLIIKDRMVRYKMISSLPVQVYFPFMSSENLRFYLGKLSFDEASYIDVHANGHMNLKDGSDWESYGHAVLKDFSHNSVPVRYAQGKYRLDGKVATFTDLTAIFDYINYPMRKAFSGPETGTLKAGRVHFNWAQQSTQVDELRGTAWPAPVLRLFAPNIANHLELYRFNLPPTVNCNGLVSWASGESNKMDLVVDFKTTGATNYNFLDADVVLNNIKGRVQVLAKDVLIENLDTSSYGGKASGYVHVRPGNLSYKSQVAWKDVSLAGISKAYGVKGINQGKLTGRFAFSGHGSELKSLRGNGKITLSEGDIFQVPLFGPLSPLIDSVISPVSKKGLVHQQATTVSCNYVIKNGRIYTEDLGSSTQSTIFAGSGWVDLVEQNLDLTIRMNFRGLLGLAEIPLKVIELPFKALKTLFTGKEVEGLKQFRGTGKIKSPTWRFTPFQPPRDVKSDPVFNR